jgi:hypothetical protein
VPGAVRRTDEHPIIIPSRTATLRSPAVKMDPDEQLGDLRAVTAGFQIREATTIQADAHVPPPWRLVRGQD